MTKFAVSIATLAWIEADSEEEALEKAPDEFVEMLEERDIDLEVVDEDEF